MAERQSADLPSELFCLFPTVTILSPNSFYYFSETTNKTIVVMDQKPSISTQQKQQIIQDWVVEIVRHTIKTDGLSEAERFFKDLKEKSDYQDLMPQIIRKVNKIFANEKQKQKKKQEKKESATARTVNIIGPNATYTENND